MSPYSLVQRPLPLDALAADHAARVNATALLTLTHARAALDEPVTELPFYNLDPPAWCPSESLGDASGSRAGTRQRTCFHATDAASMSASQQDQMVERIGRATQRLAQLHARRKLKEMRLAMLAREQARKLATRRRLGLGEAIGPSWYRSLGRLGRDGVAVGRPRPFR